jgi:hypothetical protein
MPQSKKVRQAFAIAQHQEERSAVKDGAKPKASGFKTVQARIAKKTNPRTGQPYGMKRAGAILAYSSRHASQQAKRDNPRLRRVPGS